MPTACPNNETTTLCPLTPPQRPPPNTHLRNTQVGRDEDGKLGPGWFDVTDSELYPMEEKLRTQVAVEALQVRVWWLDNNTLF